MSRRQEVCRDFQRGNCRFGARCKFVHQLPQGRQQFGGGAADQSIQPAPDHKCTDPRSCKERIKEDFTHERPTFWRLTCYAHWRHLPNDIAGDTSFEELRAVAYENAKQGLSLRDLAQREAMMSRAKEAEFDALLRNPYRGPGNETFSSHAAPFGNSGAETRTIFGKPVPANSIVSQIFGPASGGLAGGFGNGPSPLAPAFNSPAPFNSQFFSPSALNSQSLLTNPQTPFNSTPFSNPFNPTPPIPALNQQSLFNSTPPISALNHQSPFSPTPPISALNQQRPFNSPASNPQNPFNFTPPSTLNQQSSLTPASYPPSTFHSSSPNILSGQTAAANIGSGATFAPPATNPAPSLPAVSKPEVDKIWLAEAWELGQIPEDEPPLAVR